MQIRPFPAHAGGSEPRARAHMQLSTRRTRQNGGRPLSTSWADFLHIGHAHCRPSNSSSLKESVHGSYTSLRFYSRPPRTERRASDVNTVFICPFACLTVQDSPSSGDSYISLLRSQRLCVDPAELCFLKSACVQRSHQVVPLSQE